MVVKHKKGYFTRDKCIATIRPTDPEYKIENENQRIIYSIIDTDKEFVFSLNQQSGCVTLKQPLYPMANETSTKIYLSANIPSNNRTSSLQSKIQLTINFTDGVDESDEFFKIQSCGLYSNTSIKTIILKLISIYNKNQYTYGIAEFAASNIKKLFNIIDNKSLQVISDFTRYAGKKLTVPVLITDNKSNESRVKNLSVYVRHKGTTGLEFFEKIYNATLLIKDGIVGKNVVDILAMSKNVKGYSIVYMIVARNDSNIFRIVPTTGRIKISRKPLVEEKYNLTVRACDSHEQSTTTVLIKIKK